MSKTSKSLNFDGQVDLLDKLAGDYLDFTDNIKPIPENLTYKIASRTEAISVERGARKAALQAMVGSGFVKQAFDTRKFNQDATRNPRANLQTFVRSDQFIDEELQNKINIFARLVKPLEELKEVFGSQPEWHDSYSRTLHDHVNRILRVGEADKDIFRPQIAYLEQLMFARYRLSMEELSTIKESDFKANIMKKDEALSKRGFYIQSTNDLSVKQSASNINLSKDGNGLTQESIVNAIFGNNGFRKDNEKSVTRVITISITDKVED